MSITEQHMQEARERIIIALDYPDIVQAIPLFEEVPEQAIVKVGMELQHSNDCDEREVIETAKSHEKRIFYDCKLHDIPNTVAGASRGIVKTGVWAFNVHTVGGSAMMKAAVEAVTSLSSELGVTRPKVIGVTELTSISEEVLYSELNVRPEVSMVEQVVHLAKLAKNSGLDGVVASPLEIKAIREACGPDFLIITPGVRPEWASVNDQKRIMTPGEAIKAGADYLVVGRPITEYDKEKGGPKVGYNLIAEEIACALTAKSNGKEG